MVKLMKYLKGHMFPVMIIMALLVIQAICELALPGYTSDIVNIGIQQGGVDETLPKVIRGTQLEQFKMLLGQEDVTIIEESYLPISKDELTKEKRERYEKKYPLMKQEQIYELQDIEPSQQEQLEEKIQHSIVIATFMKQAKSASTQSDSKTKDPSNMSMTLDQIEKKLDEIPDSIKEQMVSAYIKAEYDAIGVNMGAIQNRYIGTVGLKMLFVALIAMLTTIFVGLIAAKVAAKLGMELRTKVFKKVVSFSNKELDQFSTASLITRSTNDIQQIQLVVVLLLRMILYAPILGLGGVIKVLNTNTSMAWIIFVGVAAILCVVSILFIVAMPKFKMMQVLVDKVNLVTREILTGLPVIRAFSTQGYEEQRFDQANKALTKNMLFTNRSMAFMMPFMMLIMNGISLMIIWFGGKGIDKGDLQVGDMMAFITYTMLIVMSFLMLTMISIMLPRAIVSAKRIDEVLDTELSIIEPKVPQEDKAESQGILEFDQVSFCYPNAEENVLEDITFTARPGETTAFIGSTGSGKSTLINLIPRFYDVTKGSIRIDGIDIRQMSGKSLRSKIGYVPQKGNLFSGTIESNMKFGKGDATTEQIQRAVAIAQAEEFIEEKEKKYQSEISQGGTNVSGGQKQRLSIARAIVKEPPIYIFDDSFSALDYKTDIALRNALKNQTGRSTVLIVAQRVSTIMHAEQIIVLDEGKIVGKGTHKELLKTNEVYQQIAMSQLSKEELEGGMSLE